MSHDARSYQQGDLWRQPMARARGPGAPASQQQQQPHTPGATRPSAVAATQLRHGGGPSTSTAASQKQHGSSGLAGLMALDNPLFSMLVAAAMSLGAYMLDPWLSVPCPILSQLLAHS